jgi:hypothetical protein
MSVSEAFLPSEERRYTSMSSNVIQLPIVACANGRHQATIDGMRLLIRGVGLF